MAGLSDQYVRMDLTLVDGYDDAGSTVDFDGPMHSLLLCNRHTTAYIYISWNQNGTDQVCLGPNQSIAVNGRPKLKSFRCRREAGVFVGSVFLDVSATGIHEFHT
jgi:hypothetical protein